MSRSSNKDNGPHNSAVQSKRKAATKPKGRHHQPRGNSNTNATPKHSKPERNPSKDMEF